MSIKGARNNTIEGEQGAASNIAEAKPNRSFNSGSQNKNSTLSFQQFWFWRRGPLKRIGRLQPPLFLLRGRASHKHQATTKRLPFYSQMSRSFWAKIASSCTNATFLRAYLPAWARCIDRKSEGSSLWDLNRTSSAGAAPSRMLQSQALTN